MASNMLNCLFSFHFCLCSTTAWCKIYCFSLFGPNHSFYLLVFCFSPLFFAYQVIHLKDSRFFEFQASIRMINVLIWGDHIFVIVFHSWCFTLKSHYTAKHSDPELFHALYTLSCVILQYPGSLGTSIFFLFPFCRPRNWNWKFEWLTIFWKNIFDVHRFIW